MTDSNVNPSNPTPAPESKATEFLKKHKFVIIASVAALVVGNIMGASGKADTGTTSSSAPTSCLTALDEADDLNRIVGLAFGNTSETMRAIRDADFGLVDALLEDSDDIASDMTSAKMGYELQADVCRGE
jgi:hypothetical protein